MHMYEVLVLVHSRAREREKKSEEAGAPMRSEEELSLLLSHP